MRRLPRIFDRAEVFISLTAIFLSGLISILDLFGLLDAVPWLSQRIPALTLLLVSLVLTILVVMYRKNLDVIQSMLIELQIERFLSIKERLDPQLMKVFGRHISDLFENIQSAVNKQSICIDDINLFRYFYKETLDVYPGSTFLATSIASQRYFWKNPSTEKAIARFVSNGGTMKRIFFIETTIDDMNKEEMEIIKKQIDIGIEVYVTSESDVPKDLVKLFLVEDNGHIAWEMTIGPMKDIALITATSNHNKTQEYIHMFNKLIRLDTTHRVKRKQIQA